MFKSLLVMSALLFAAQPAWGAGALQEPGAMLRAGQWISANGSYAVPQAFSQRAPSSWPRQGWFKLTLGKHAVTMRRVQSPPGDMPAFLAAITRQVEVNLGMREHVEPERQVESGEYVDFFYLRVPGVKLKNGTVAAYKFRNGTRQLVPERGRRYVLELNQRPFAFTTSHAQGGTGRAQAQGYKFTAEYDGRRFDYVLGADVTQLLLKAIADIDRDGRPDFILYAASPDSGFDVVLLSSTARPGRNPPTASLEQENW